MPPKYIQLSMILLKGWFGFFILWFTYMLMQSMTSLNIVILILIVLLGYMGVYLLFTQSIEIINFFAEITNNSR